MKGEESESSRRGQCRRNGQGMKITPCNRSGDRRGGEESQGRAADQSVSCAPCDVRGKGTRVILLVRNSEQTLFLRHSACPKPARRTNPKWASVFTHKKSFPEPHQPLRPRPALMALFPLVSLSPAGPLPATALIITSYYLGGPIIDSWAVGKRAAQLRKLSRRPFFRSGGISSELYHPDQCRDRDRKCLFLM